MDVLIRVVVVLGVLGFLGSIVGIAAYAIVATIMAKVAERRARGVRGLSDHQKAELVRRLAELPAVRRGDRTGDYGPVREVLSRIAAHNGIDSRFLFK